MEYWHGILALIGAVLAILAYFVGAFRWVWAKIGRLRGRLTRQRPRVPRSMLRIVPTRDRPWWYLGTSTRRGALLISCAPGCSNLPLRGM